MELTHKVKIYFTKDLHISKFCVEAEISRKTFIRRRKSPEKFKAKEIKAIKKLVGVREIFKK